MELLHWCALSSYLWDGSWELPNINEQCQIHYVTDRNQSPSRLTHTKKSSISHFLRTILILIILFFIHGFNVVVDQQVTVAPNFTQFNIKKIFFYLPGHVPLQWQLYVWSIFIVLCSLGWDSGFLYPTYMKRISQSVISAAAETRLHTTLVHLYIASHLHQECTFVSKHSFGCTRMWGTCDWGLLFL